MIRMYGIKNCDTIKKAIDWFKTNKIPFEFHDYKEEGITAARLKEWAKQVGWEVLFNKKSATFRNLKEEEKKTATTASAIKIMKEHTSIIKRPVIEGGKDLVVGFDKDVYHANFKS